MKKDEELTKELLELTREYRAIAEKRKKRNVYSNEAFEEVSKQMTIMGRVYTIVRKLLLGDF